MIENLNSENSKNKKISIKYSSMAEIQSVFKEEKTCINHGQNEKSSTNMKMKHPESFNIDANLKEYNREIQPSCETSGKQCDINVGKMYEKFEVTASNISEADIDHSDKLLIVINENEVESSKFKNDSEIDKETTTGVVETYDINISEITKSEKLLVKEILGNENKNSVVVDRNEKVFICINNKENVSSKNNSPVKEINYSQDIKKCCSRLIYGNPISNVNCHGVTKADFVDLSHVEKSSSDIENKLYTSSFGSCGFMNNDTVTDDLENNRSLKNYFTLEMSSNGFISHSNNSSIYNRSIKEPSSTNDEFIFDSCFVGELISSTNKDDSSLEFDSNRIISDFNVINKINTHIKEDDSFQKQTDSDEIMNRGRVTDVSSIRTNGDDSNIMSNTTTIITNNENNSDTKTSNLFKDVDSNIMLNSTAIITNDENVSDTTTSNLLKVDESNFMSNSTTIIKNDNISDIITSNLEKSDNSNIVSNLVTIITNNENNSDKTASNLVKGDNSNIMSNSTAVITNNDVMVEKFFNNSKDGNIFQNCENSKIDSNSNNDENSSLEIKNENLTSESRLNENLNVQIDPNKEYHNSDEDYLTTQIHTRLFEKGIEKTEIEPKSERNIEYENFKAQNKAGKNTKNSTLRELPPVELISKPNEHTFLNTHSNINWVSNSNESILNNYYEGETIVNLIPIAEKILERWKSEAEFNSEYRKFLAKNNVTINKTPIIGFVPINIYKMFKNVILHGGYKKVTKDHKWKTIFFSHGPRAEITNATTCTRRHYEKLLYPFERYITFMYSGNVPLDNFAHEFHKMNQNLCKSVKNTENSNNFQDNFNIENSEKPTVEFRKRRNNKSKNKAEIQLKNNKKLTGEEKKIDIENQNRQQTDKIYKNQMKTCDQNPQNVNNVLESEGISGIVNSTQAFQQMNLPNNYQQHFLNNLYYTISGDNAVMNYPHIISSIEDSSEFKNNLPNVNTRLLYNNNFQNACMMNTWENSNEYLKNMNEDFNKSSVISNMLEPNYDYFYDNSKLFSIRNHIPGDNSLIKIPNLMNQNDMIFDSSSHVNTQNTAYLKSLNVSNLTCFQNNNNYDFRQLDQNLLKCSENLSERMINQQFSLNAAKPLLQISSNINPEIINNQNYIPYYKIDQYQPNIGYFPQNPGYSVNVTDQISMNMNYQRNLQNSNSGLIDTCIQGNIQQKYNNFPYPVVYNPQIINHETIQNLNEISINKIINEINLHGNLQNVVNFDNQVDYQKMDNFVLNNSSNVDIQSSFDDVLKMNDFIDNLCNQADNREQENDIFNISPVANIQSSSDNINGHLNVNLNSNNQLNLTNFNNNDNFQSKPSNIHVYVNETFENKNPSNFPNTSNVTNTSIHNNNDNNNNNNNSNSNRENHQMGAHKVENELKLNNRSKCEIMDFSFFHSKKKRNSNEFILMNQQTASPKINENITVNNRLSTQNNSNAQMNWNQNAKMPKLINISRFSTNNKVLNNSNIDGDNNINNFINLNNQSSFQTIYNDSNSFNYYAEILKNQSDIANENSNPSKNLHKFHHSPNVLTSTDVSNNFKYINILNEQKVQHNSIKSSTSNDSFQISSKDVLNELFKTSIQSNASTGFENFDKNIVNNRITNIRIADEMTNIMKYQNEIDNYHVGGSSQANFRKFDNPQKSDGNVLMNSHKSNETHDVNSELYCLKSNEAQNHAEILNQNDIRIGIHNTGQFRSCPLDGTTKSSNDVFVNSQTFDNITFQDIIENSFNCSNYISNMENLKYFKIQENPFFSQNLNFLKTNNVMSCDSTTYNLQNENPTEINNDYITPDLLHKTTITQVKHNNDNNHLCVDQQNTNRTNFTILKGTTLKEHKTHSDDKYENSRYNRETRSIELGLENIHSKNRSSITTTSEVDDRLIKKSL